MHDQSRPFVSPPGPVTATAILNLLMGAAGIIGAAFALYIIPTVSKSLDTMPDVRDPSLSQQATSLKTMSTVIQSVGIPLMIAGAIVSAALVVASIGMLSLRSWARSVTLAIGWLSLLYSVVIIIAGLMQQRWSASIPGETSIYWILVITLLMSRDVKAAFDRAAALRAAQRAAHTDSQSPLAPPSPAL